MKILAPPGLKVFLFITYGTPDRAFVLETVNPLDLALGEVLVLVLVQGEILRLDLALGEDLVLVLVLGEGAERTERGTHGNPH